MTKLDSRLNLVVPIEREDGSTIYVHSMPISREVFEANFLVISKAFTALFAQQLNVRSGPRVAHLMLRQTAQEMGIWDTVQGSLMAEIRRLSNVLMPGANGWDTVPYQDALNRKLINQDDASEAEGAICFFILTSAMFKKRNLESFLEAACDLWGMSVTLLNVTDYGNSLTKLTTDENTGATAVA